MALASDASGLRGKFDVRLRSVTAAAAVILATLSGHGASAQATRPIKVVVPYAPGGGTDVLARLLAEQIGRVQGQAMLIENRPGANTIIGTEAVSRAAPDGNTLLIAPPDFVIQSAFAQGELRSDNELRADLQPRQFAAGHHRQPASPHRTLADLFDSARAKPGALTWGSPGPATVTYIAFELLIRSAKVDMTFIPYPGGAPSVNALLGEHLTSAFTDYPPVAEQLKRDEVSPSRGGIHESVGF